MIINLPSFSELRPKSVVSSLEFGEHEGHEFRGNQYTGPRFGDSVKEPVGFLQQGKAAYAVSAGLPSPSDKNWGEIAADPQRLSSIARDYDALPLRSADAIPAYDALRSEVGKQYDYLTNTLGVKVESVTHDPYKNVEEMRNDVAENHHLSVLSTDATGPHPYFSNTENDQFRAVHDAFGHAAIGRGFDRNGEEAAFQSHAQMFSPLATRALATETRGQNSELITTGQFPAQKLALLPETDSMSAAATLFDADDDNLYDVTHVHHASLGRRLTAVVSALELGDVAGHGFHGNQYEKVGGEGKLPDSLYMATAEEGNLSWSASKIQTMRDQVDAVVPGLSKAVSRWGGSFRGTDLIQARSDLIMHGMDDKYPHFTDEDKRADADAQALMRGVEISGPTTKDLYRGINIPFDGTGHSGEYTVGQEVNFSLASFTERQKWADNFASGQMKLGAPAAGTPILFHLEKGSQALPIDAMRGLATSPENEWVSGGKFTVSSVEPYQLDPLMSDRQGLKVTLHQVDTVHP